MKMILNKIFNFKKYLYLHINLSSIIILSKSYYNIKINMYVLNILYLNVL